MSKSIETKLRNPEGFKIMELAIVSESLHQGKFLDKEIISILERQFVAKIENSNAQDLAIFWKILFTNKEFIPKDITAKKLLETADQLYHNIDQNCLRKMFENFSDCFLSSKYSDESVSFLFRKLKNLMKDDQIRGGNLNYILQELEKLKSNDKIRSRIKKLPNK